MSALNPKPEMKMPLKGNQQMSVTGTKARLIVGDSKVMFFIHNATLSHFASGYKFGQLNPIKIRNMCHRGHLARMTDRQAAQTLIDDTVARLGAEKVLATLNAAPVLNS